MSRGPYPLSIVLALASVACAGGHEPMPVAGGVPSHADNAGGGGQGGAPSAGAAAEAAGSAAPGPSRIRTVVRNGASAAAGSSPTNAGEGATAGAQAGAGGAPTAGTEATAGTGSGETPPDEVGWSTFCGEFPVELLEVPEAGTGTISGCAPRTCTSSKLPDAADSDAIVAFQRPDAPAPPLSDYAGCTTIDGDLVINGSVGDDLSALHCLERVKGTILVWYNPTLRSLDGLDSLALVDGDLLIGGPFVQLYAPNDMLSRIDALANLRAVRGSLSVDGSALTSLHGLEGLRATGRSLKISIVRGMRDLHGLEHVQVIGEHLHFMRPEGLLSLAGLDSLRIIYGGFWLSGGIDLLSVSGLPELGCVGGIFDFAGSEYAYSNDRLRAADGFPKLTAIGGDALLGPHPMLESATLFGHVAQIRGVLEVRGSPQLRSLDISRLERVHGGITVIDNAALDECVVHAQVDPLVQMGWAGPSRIEGLRGCPAPQYCIAGACGF